MTRFNRICFTFALFWLSITVPAGLIFRPTIPDFGQFYTSGSIVRAGKWNALYPTPWRGSLDNAGLHSNAKNDWVLMSAERGAPNYTHFILPPFSALLFVPLSFLSYVQAFWLWTLLLSASVLGVAWISAELLREIIGKESRWEGALMLLIVLSPTTARSIRISNVSPFIALSIAVVLRAILRDQTYRGGFALVLGILLKYATLILAPLLILTKRWRMIAWSVALLEVALGVTLMIAGSRPFYEFARIIAPTLSRPSAYLGNQALSGMLVREFGRPLPPMISEVLINLRMAAFTCVVFALARLRHTRAQTPVNILAASSLLISWLLIFSPIAWEHWAVFLCPAWGWILWEAMPHRTDSGSGWSWRRVCAIASLVLMYFPAGIIQVPGFATYPLTLSEPWNSSQLLGFVLLFILSFNRLYGHETVASPVVSQSQRRGLLSY